METSYAAPANFGEDEMRHIAARIESDNPQWVVLFGVYTREFIAFARFEAPSGRVIAAHDPDALPGRMRRIENTAAGRGAFTPRTNPQTAGQR